MDGAALVAKVFDAFDRSASAAGEEVTACIVGE